MPSGIEHTPETRARFLAALALTGKVSGEGGAAERAEIAVPTLYAWRNKDPDFAEAWDQAKRMRREIIAEKGWNVVEEILDDPVHKDRLAAARVAIDNSPDTHDSGGVDDGIAEAIDRFTQLVAGLAKPAPNLQDALTGRSALGTGDTDRQGDG